LKKKYWILLVVCLGVLLLDQWTKYMVQEKLPLYQSVEVIKGFFDLTHVRNTGGAFSVFGGEKGGIGSYLFVAVSLLAIGVILFLVFKSKEDGGLLTLSLSLILGGAVGNLIDRFRYGEVIDFLDFHLHTFYWPVFNIADSAISIGVILMAFELLFRDKRGSTK
jgi:signal peptidase II